ncbi:hypothetical protein [Staphylococcus chromogenes]|uniref:hypothetical protein n=1 Tax=Staphylococcus chromogenes TaxID=46126 RepID=UPI002888C50E|nr:hypothetical protein [Staphylococcus chromogenes]MDT0716829.1 hypothetical protein [Staphylococcus chromogenes]MDT0736815.1 hypothetical protein [Staphylococcus chromogenes]MDT0750885.1 hypothetical protein [Staphylococcus chromogenes]
MTKYLKLKKRYQVLKSETPNNELMIYDKENEILILKLDASSVTNRLLDIHISEFSFFQAFDSLKYSKNGRIIQQIYIKKPDIFDVINDENNKMIEDKNFEEKNKIINLPNMYSTYESSKQINDLSYFLYGCNSFNHNLILNLKKNKLSLYLVTCSHFEKMTSSLKFLDDFDFSSYADYYYYLEQNYNVKVLDIRNLEFYYNEYNIFNIIDNEYYELLKMMNVNIHKTFTLHFGFYSRNFTFGPLILDNKLDYYDILVNKYSDQFINSVTSNSLIILGMVYRVICYSKNNTFKYIADDVNIPVNQVYIFDNLSLNSQVVDLEVDLI